MDFYVSAEIFIEKKIPILFSVWKDEMWNVKYQFEVIRYSVLNGLDHEVLSVKW